jgi:cobalt-zinc-cadmium efflux system protein
MEQPHEHPAEESQRLLKIGILLSFLIFILELGGGLWTHSLALTSDAWHIFIDIWSLVISFLAIMVAKRPVNDRQTFGLHRMEVMAATLNGASVFLIALGILVAAWRRLHAPVEVHSLRLLIISSTGLALNLLVAWLFYRRSHEDLNLRGVFMHILGDALNTFAVILAAILMMATRWPLIDPIISAAIALVVLWGAAKLLKESFNTLLEGVPANIQVNDVEQHILGVEGVDSVHDLHVWSICSHLNALSGHVLLAPEHMGAQHQVLEQIGNLLKQRFGIVHTTVQVESKAWPRLDEGIGQVGQVG